jgi:peptidyl-prolyl cis-trans isomerase SurA
MKNFPFNRQPCRLNLPIMHIDFFPKKATGFTRLACMAVLLLWSTLVLTPVSMAQGAGAAARQPRLVDTIAAVVNNEVITYQELTEKMILIERRMTAQGAAMPPRSQLQRQLLERMILDRAQMQLAKEIGIRVDDTMLDRALLRIAEQNKLSPADFRVQVEKDGVSFARFREEIRTEITLQRLREREVDNKLQITESELDNFIEANGGSSAQARAFEFNLAHILVRIPENASAEQIAQRRQRAEEAMQQLKAGADFAKVAASYSDGAEALKGGEIGWRSPDRLPQLFVEAIARLNQGEISELIKSANGFHILKLVGKRTPSLVRAGTVLPTVQQTRVRHILIKVNQVVSSADARRRLVELKERLTNNAAKFEELAKLHSNDFSSSKGGDLGWIYPGDTVPEFEQAMNALTPGQVSEPVETPFGFHLIQVLERKNEDLSQERQRLVARQALRERKLEEATEEWLRQLRDRAYVEYRGLESEPR